MSNVIAGQFNRGQRARRKVEIDERVFVEPPPAPSNMNKLARIIWADTADVLVARHSLTEGDLEASRLFCDSAANVQRFRQQLETEGYTICRPSDGHMVKHPAVMLLNDAIQHLRAATLLLGLSPHGRGMTGSAQKRPIVGEDPTTIAGDF